MNKRIELLAVQAGFNIHNDVIDGHNFNHEIQKLVELIIGECVSIAEAGNAVAVAGVIKEKFGVDEC
jgi:hypothetical protein